MFSIKWDKRNGPLESFVGLLFHLFHVFYQHILTIHINGAECDNWACMHQYAVINSSRSDASLHLAADLGQSLFPWSVHFYRCNKINKARHFFFFFLRRGLLVWRLNGVLLALIIILWWMPSQWHKCVMGRIMIWDNKPESKEEYSGEQHRFSRAVVLNLPEAATL